MKRNKNFTILLPAIFFYIIALVGCGRTENQNSFPLESPDVKTDIWSQLPDEYQQITLYIQEGFRKYNIEGNYHIYFNPIDENDYGNFCDVLLEGEEENSWYEVIFYTYDATTGWYNFEGQYEPILANAQWRSTADSSYKEEIKENFIYDLQLSKNTDISIPIHYNSESGPIERDEIYFFHFQEINNPSYSVNSQLYTYQDDRLKVEITIEYPAIYNTFDSELDDNTVENINEKIKEAFFYGYEYEGAENILRPENELYIQITRQYSVTRADENYLSLRIYEYNSSRLANHPNEWETGITIDMHTGEVLTLQDVLGEEWTPETLFTSGLFNKFSWTLEGDDSGNEWMNYIIENAKDKTLSDYNTYFYLTDENLGLITFMSRYYNMIEANIEELNQIHSLPFLQ